MAENLGTQVAYNTIISNINGPAHRFEDDFRRMFAVEHPTLQQALVRHLIIPALEILAAQNPDARNQAAHDFAVDALAATGNVYLPTI